MQSTKDKTKGTVTNVRHIPASLIPHSDLDHLGGETHPYGPPAICIKHYPVPITKPRAADMNRSRPRSNDILSIK